MKVDSPAALRSAFARWRRKKRHVREAIPQELLDRARRASEVHGEKAVVEATKVERSRLFRERKQVNRSKVKKVRSAPSFSRVELSAPSRERPIAEVETAGGLKLRIYSQTPESLQLLSALCKLGDDQ